MQFDGRDGRGMAALFSSLFHGRRGHGGSTRLDGFDDVVITRAATDIAFELFANGVLIQRRALTFDDVDARHDHAGCAVATLQGMMFTEGCLHGVQRLAIRDALNRYDVSTIAGQSQRRAALDCLTIDVNHTGATLARITANVRTRQTLLIPEELDQECARLDLCCHGFAVQGQR